jgi:hypothetical protein
VHRIALRMSRTRLSALWTVAYSAVARLWAAYLTHGERGAATYLRASVSAGEWLPGLSDIDVAIVLASNPATPGAARTRATERWERVRRAVPAADLLLDYPLIYEEDDLRGLAGASAFTYGLDPGQSATGYFGPRSFTDGMRTLERPGLYGVTEGWRRLSGPERRPPDVPRDEQLQRMAGWLELGYWWQWAFPVCVDGTGPRTAHLCVKLVSESARIWLSLAHGEQVSGRADALRRARRRLPDEADSLDRVLALHRALRRFPEPPLAEVLPVLLRFSARIADLIAAAASAAGTTAVRLIGDRPADLLLAEPGDSEPSLLPLCDWRALTWSPLHDEAFAPRAGDPGDPSVVGAAASRSAGPYPALRAGELMFLPSVVRWRTRLRAVKCPAADPVSFALADGQAIAQFPELRGWSARDVARRAVAEHRARLDEASDLGGPGLAMLLAAARGALFLESVEDGAPELAVTVAATAGRLAARSAAARSVAEDALDCYRDYATERVRPPDATIAALRALVLDLPGYAGRGAPVGQPAG